MGSLRTITIAKPRRMKKSKKYLIDSPLNDFAPTFLDKDGNFQVDSVKKESVVSKESVENLSEEEISHQGD